ncbi:MAG: NAD(P)-binding domain-containing protein [Acidimicrobiales bacterium]
MDGSAAVVVGAGHAGLAVSRLLVERGIDHVVLERRRVAERWRSERWDSFTLLTPNWASWLPGWRYDGDQPNGFMLRDDVVSYLERYARSFGAPVREGVEVQALEQADGGGYLLRTGDGELRASTVVVATGPFQVPRLPPWSSGLPPEVVQVHSSTYRGPAGLPDGAVVVVGTGASGQQIVEDLLRGGRRVYLCVGRSIAVPRRYRGRDFIWWQEHAGFYERTVEDVPVDQRRHGVSPALTGFGGGHDLDLRELHSQGVTLLGRALGTERGRLLLGTGLAESLAAGDGGYAQFVDWVEARIHRFGIPFEDPEPRRRFPEPPEPPLELDLHAAGVTAVVWATGFRPDYASWVRLPVLDADGHPQQVRGATACPGVYFIGRNWLYRSRSPFIRGAEEDARHIVSLIAGP